MTIYFIVFATAVLAGLAFWIYNRRQMTELTEQLEDKNAIINAFRDHLSGDELVSHPTSVTPVERETPNVERKPKKKQQKQTSPAQQKTKNQNDSKSQKTKKNR